MLQGLRGTLASANLGLRNFSTTASNMVLRVGWHREHFLSPLLQLVEQDQGKTFTLVECPGGTGDMQAKLKNDEIDVCIGES